MPYRTELRDAVRELERCRDAGTYVCTQDDITLAQWLDQWLEVVLPMTARWKTLSTYRSQDGDPRSRARRWVVA